MDWVDLLGLLCAFGGGIAFATLFRRYKMRHLRQRAAKTDHAELPIEAIKPFLTEKRLSAGQTLFRKGDAADDGMYYIAEGEIELAEFPVVCRAGDIVGEMGAFAPSRGRIATAVCRVDATLYCLSADKARELYFRNPEFGFDVLSLILDRLSTDLEYYARLAEHSH